MIIQMFPQPGSVVLNQSPTHPMSGRVVKSPVPARWDDWVWVKWSDGVECEEHLFDLTLTGVLFLESGSDEGDVSNLLVHEVCNLPEEEL